MVKIPDFELSLYFFQRLRTENRLLRQRVDLLEQESSNLADRLIQGQVTRAEVEETTFAIKRELAAIKQHDLDTNQQLEEAKDRIRKLSSIVDDREETASTGGASVSSGQPEGGAVKAEVLRQKEEMIHCLQDELIKERLREAENEERIRDLTARASDFEAEIKRLREAVPENDVASLQEELAAAKLREAEANLALKELRTKVSELSCMWQKHLKRSESESGANGDGPSVSVAPSTPKKLLGSLLDAGGASKTETARLEEELMTARVGEVNSQAELKESRLKVMELETQVRLKSQLVATFKELSPSAPTLSVSEPSDRESTEEAERRGCATAREPGDQDGEGGLARAHAEERQAAVRRPGRQDERGSHDGEDQRCGEHTVRGRADAEDFFARV